MNSFNPQKFVQRMFGCVLSPSGAVREAINENAIADAIFSIIGANIAVAIFSMLYGVYCNIFTSYSAPIISHIPRMIIHADIAILFNVIICMFVGAKFGGRGSLVELFIAFGIVAVPTALIAAIGSIPTFLLSIPAVIVNFFIRYSACKEAHRFEEHWDVIITIIITTVLVYVANYLVSYVI